MEFCWSYCLHSPGIPTEFQWNYCRHSPRYSPVFHWNSSLNYCRHSPRYSTWIPPELLSAFPWYSGLFHSEFCWNYCQYFPGIPLEFRWNYCGIWRYSTQFRAAISLELLLTFSTGILAELLLTFCQYSKENKRARWNVIKFWSFTFKGTQLDSGFPLQAYWTSMGLQNCRRDSSGLWNSGPRILMDSGMFPRIPLDSQDSGPGIQLDSRIPGRWNLEFHWIPPGILPRPEIPAEFRWNSSLFLLGLGLIKLLLCP